MAHISVVFPDQPRDSGGSPLLDKYGKPAQLPPMVLNDPKPVMGGRFISWHIHSYDPRIKEVEIKFQEDENNPKRHAEYFDVKAGTITTKQREYGKSLVKPTSGSPYKAECIIWGQAPPYDPSLYDSAKNHRLVEKYTIIAKLDGAPDIELDPEIINDKPRP